MTTYEAHLTYVDGGLLPRLRETLRRPVPYLDLRVLWGDGDAPDFWAEAAREAGWQFKQVSRECFEVTFPDGTHLLDPTRARATTVDVLRTTCSPAGMSTICTSQVHLRVPDGDRGPAARCRPFRAPRKEAPPRELAPVLPRFLPSDQAFHVLSLLRRLRSTRSMRELSEAVGMQESGLYKILRGNHAPTANLAHALARMLHVSVSAVLEGRPIQD